MPYFLTSFTISSPLERLGEAYLTIMNLKQQTFITEFLRHRSAYTAYCLAYHVKDETKYDSIMSAANRLLNDPKVGGVIDSVLKGIRHEVEQEIRAELKADLLTVQRKREILAKIATGEFYAVHNYKGKDCSMCTQHVWPTINQVLKAVDLDNKMAGLYSVDKRQFTVDKPFTAPAFKADVLLQVDKFIQSAVLTVEQTEKSRESQQNTTIPPLKEVPKAEDVHSRSTENTSKPQQIPTNKLETPLLTKEGTMTNNEACLSLGEVDSHRTENASKPQQITTKAPLGIGVKSDAPAKQGHHKYIDYNT